MSRRIITRATIHRDPLTGKFSAGTPVSEAVKQKPMLADPVPDKPIPYYDTQAAQVADIKKLSVCKTEVSQPPDQDGYAVNNLNGITESGEAFYRAWNARTVPDPDIQELAAEEAAKFGKSLIELGLKPDPVMFAREHGRLLREQYSPGDYYRMRMQLEADKEKVRKARQDILLKIAEEFNKREASKISHNGRNDDRGVFQQPSDRPNTSRSSGLMRGEGPSFDYSSFSSGSRGDSDDSPRPMRRRDRRRRYRPFAPQSLGETSGFTDSADTEVSMGDEDGSIGY